MWPAEFYRSWFGKSRQTHMRKMFCRMSCLAGWEEHRFFTKVLMDLSGLTIMFWTSVRHIVHSKHIVDTLIVNARLWSLNDSSFLTFWYARSKRRVLAFSTWQPESYHGAFGWAWSLTSANGACLSTRDLLPSISHYSLNRFTIEVTPLGFISDMSNFFKCINVETWSNEIWSDKQQFQNLRRYTV